jgi:Kef-type K+ transport system membrane component KefB
MIMVIGIGFIIAAVAGLMGFSVAIGAFFAGLVFSRDPRAVRMEESFTPLYEFFTPFFFIGIGLSIDPTMLITALGLGFILLIAAVLGKVIGAGGPAFLTLGSTGSLLLGVSMVPRAEIAMVIMERGYKLGDWAVPPEVFGAMAVVSAATCLISPVILRLLLKRWPQHAEDGY